MIRLLKKFLQIVVLFILIGIFIIIYAFFIEPNLLIERVYTLKSKESNSSTPFRVVQLSDIHISKSYREHKLKRLVEQVNQLNADIIVFTGDLFDNFSVYQSKDIVTNYLSQLTASYGKYAVWGNRDYGGGAFRSYHDIMNESNFTLLENSSVLIELENGASICIGGVDDYLLGKPDMKKLVQQMEDATYKIMLMHEPDKAQDLEQTDLNLILAGHSHGGQVKIPFLNVITTSLAEKYINGFYTINETTNLKLFVNSGIGTTRIPARFLVPPEIAIFDIQV